jgi:hypothetical protein
LRHSKDSAKRKICNCKHQNIRQISKICTSNSEKQKQGNPKFNGWKEIMKIRAEISEIETKRTMQRINETMS